MNNYIDIFRFLEKKDHIINKLPITDEQKQIAIDFFNKHPNYESELGSMWNNPNLSWEDLEKVIYKVRDTKSQIKKAVKKGIEGIEEGVDYIDVGSYQVPNQEGTFQMYIPLTWKGSRTLASDNVPPELHSSQDGYTGAKWCISYQKSDEYWRSYSQDSFFVFVFSKDIPTKKLAVQLKKKYIANRNFENLKAFFSGGSYVIVWDSSDRTIPLDYDTPVEKKVSTILTSIFKSSQVIEKYFLPKIDKLLSLEDEAQKIWIKNNTNPKTGLVDVKGDVTVELSYPRKDSGYLFIKPPKSNRISPSQVFVDIDGNQVPVRMVSEGLIEIPFGKVTGSFFCGSKELVSLKNCPRYVGGDFYVSRNNLTSLEYSPKEVAGDFCARQNKLTSLEGISKKIGNHLDVSFNSITSLKGIPENIKETANVSILKNELDSLEGLPEQLNNLECSYNKLTSLKGAPKLITGTMSCGENQLTTLEGAPERVEYTFACSNNKLTSFKGAPNYVGGYLYADQNDFKSVEDFDDVPDYIGRDLILNDCSNLKLSKEDITKIKKDKNILGRIVY